MKRDAYKEPWQVAALIAEMMRRSERTRARLSEITLKGLAGRKKLETSIRSQIHSDALDYGYLMYRLDPRGATSGTVVLALSSLHAAKPLKANALFDEDELRVIKDGSFDFAELHDQLLGEDDEKSDDD
jgi:hypothetical protein